jgi:dipeptidyl aminopeptidase/acylaminoacyl peptidase
VALSGGFAELEDPTGFIRLGAPVYLQHQRFIDDSPLLNLEHATTPTLLFAAEMDGWGAGQEAVYMTLMREGVPTQLVTYWGENHMLESPGNIKDMIDREVAWFTKYLAP